MWHRVNDRFGLAEDDPKGKDKDKKPSSKAKQAEKEDKRVEKRLTELRTLGKGNLSDPKEGKRFLNSRDTAAKAMKKYCKLLKSNELKEDVQDLTNFRKAVKQLVVVVESLEARPYPETDEGEPDMGALGKVDTSQLDKAMEDPKFGEYSDAELDQDEAETTAEEAAPEAGEGGPVSTPPRAPPPPDIRPLQFKQKLQQLMPAYQQALQAGAPGRGELELAMKLAMAAAKAKDFEQGLVQLAKVEAGLKKPAAPPSAPPKAPGADPAAEYKAKLAEWTPALKAAMAARGPGAAGIAKLLAQATALSKPGGDIAQALEKLTECHKLATAGAASAPVSNVAFQQSLLTWDAARKKMHADLQALEREILELFADDPRLAEVSQKARKLDAVLGDYAEELRDRLDEAYNAPAEEKPALRSGAVAVLKRYRAYLSTDPFIKAVAANLLHPIDIEGVLGKALDNVAGKLGA
jgi:hypothetical protein